jgi:elongation factor P
VRSQRLKANLEGESEAALASTSDFRNGMVIRFREGLWSIVEFQHVKPGKGGAFVRTKLKNVETGRVVEETFRAGEKVEEVRIDRQDYQYLYREADFLTFMNLVTYEQMHLPVENIEDVVPFLKEGEKVILVLHEERPLAVEPPYTVELKVVKTDPGVRGDTAQGGSKPATMETGLVVQVPLFIEQGEVLKVDTRTGKYLGRV